MKFTKLLLRVIFYRYKLWKAKHQIHRISHDMTMGIIIYDDYQKEMDIAYKVIEVVRKEYITACDNLKELR